MAPQLRDALGNRGIFSASFVLAYVFVVPLRPRDLPLAGPAMPVATILFLVGLVNLILCTFWSYFLVQIMEIRLRNKSVQA